MEYPQEMKKALASCRFVGVTYLVCLLVYLVFEEILRARTRPFLGFFGLKDPTVLRYAGYAAAVVFVVLTRLLNGRMLKSGGRDDRTKAVRTLYRTTVLSLTLAEVPALIGLALFFLGGLNMDFYILMFVSLVLLFMYFPRSAAWEAYLQHRPLSCRFRASP